MAADGKAYQGRRILFANGVTDRLPEIPGVADRWGRSIFHCPYCHGYELDQGRIGVLWTGPMSVHQAELLAEWGTVTYFTNGSGLPDQPVQQMLEGKGVTLDDTPITPIEGEAGHRPSGPGRRLLHRWGLRAVRQCLVHFLRAGQ